MMKRLFTLLCALTLACAAEAKTVEAASPGGNLRLAVDVSDRITYGLWSGEDKILENCTLSLTLADRTLGEKPRLRSVKRSSADEVLERRNPTKNASVRNRYNAVRLNFAGGYAVEFRLFDDGAACRFVTSLPGEVEVMGEACRLGFPAGSEAWLSEVDGFRSMYEEPYTRVATAEYDSADRMSYLPVLVGMPGGKKVLLAESDVRDYPCMFVRGDGAGGFESLFPRVPKEYAPAGDRSLKIVAEEPYIARTQGTRTFPWRVAVVAEKDAALIENELVWLLAEPAADADWDWVKPGLVSWDWWNGMRLTGVDFRAGRNTESYRYYIDFAAEKGIEYVILDEGWAVNKQADLMQVVPEIDLPEIVNYGQQKGVGIILWAGYWAFDRDLENVCKHYSEMGVKGFKVDFMDRDDQQMTAFNYRAAATAARYGLILDLHGTHKPAGLNRTWPNVLNFEGVHGLEQMKWSPESVDQMKYDVTIPFIRQAAGPMDYTQGAMRNATRNNYRPVNSEPMSQGTRCHQLALYVVLDSPLNMLCDSPTAYLHEKECTEFIAAIPTVWDETRILGGRLGEYIVTARRKGSTWYVGGITDWTPRDVEIDLAPLGIDATVEATIFRDGANADRKASDYRRASIRIDTSKPLTVHLAPGGGFVVKIED